MSASGWGIKSKGDLTLYNRDPPSCFSNRVARVRRSNSLEDRRLQEKLRSIHLEHSIKRGQIFKEAKTLAHQLTGIQKVRETPEIGLERRKLQQAKAVNQFVFHKIGNSGIHSVHRRAYSASSLPSGLSPHFASSTNVTPTVRQYPRVDCRCCYTGYRLRRASTMAMDVRTPLSPKFPLDTSTQEPRENFPFPFADGENKSGMSFALAMDHEQHGRQLFQRLPSIENNR